MRADHFCCRYCGCEVVPTSLLFLINSLYPHLFLLNANYADYKTHSAVWTRGAEADHVVPLARGGSATDPANLVTCCVHHNYAKRDRQLDEIGWSLNPAIDTGWDGLVPLYRQVWESLNRPNAKHHANWLAGLEG